MNDNPNNPQHEEEPISQGPTESLLYVAPLEPPEDRRPPLTQVGIFRWLKENLFSSTADTIMTLVTLVAVIVFTGGFLNWALFEAQWEIDFLNLRVLNVGPQFPIAEVWRAETVAMIVVFLTMMSVAVWGRLTRAVLVVVGFITVLMIAVPILTQSVPEPAVHVWVEADYEVRQLSFIAQENQEFEFTLDPLTTPEEYKIAGIHGYIENDNQGANTSFDMFTQADTEISFLETRDPTEYDLSVIVQVWDEDGEVIFESEPTEASEEVAITSWTAPAAGWYTVTALVPEDNGTLGAAWLKIHNLEILRSTIQAVEETTAMYGPVPEIDCRCATTAYRTDMRYEGRRTLAQWFSLQFSPFLEETRDFYFLALFTGAVGYLIGLFARRASLSGMSGLIQRWRRPISLITTGLFLAYVAVILFGGILSPEVRQAVYVPVVLGFTGAAILLASNYMLDDNKQFLNRGMSLLWGASVPIVILILTGTIGSSLLPAIDTENFGGLLLTLMLSAVAIGASFPIGVALALGRQSDLPVVSLLSTIFIEVLRGVPLITLLFMGRLILPFFGFGLADVALVIRTMVVMTLFTSAYMAEVVRGGLQIIPKGQIEAAQALGLNNFWTTTLIRLPQALRAVIPAMMGQAVSLFKDTTLVYIIGLFEILGTMNQLLGDSQTGYTAFPREGYLFVGVVYFVFSYIMADVSRRIERTGSGVVRRDTV